MTQESAKTGREPCLEQKYRSHQVMPLRMPKENAIVSSSLKARKGYNGYSYSTEHTFIKETVRDTLASYGSVLESAAL